MPISSHLIPNPKLKGQKWPFVGSAAPSSKLTNAGTVISGTWRAPKLIYTKRMKIFLSVSFSSQIDDKGVVNAAYRSDLETLIQKLQEADHDVFCAPMLEGWKVTDDDPVHALQEDLRELNECDLYVALLGQEVSAGVQLETGYALALKKRMILASPAGTTLGWTNNALSGFNNISNVNYEFYDELGEQILQLTHR